MEEEDDRESACFTGNGEAAAAGHVTRAAFPPPHGALSRSLSQVGLPVPCHRLRGVGLVSTWRGLCIYVA